MLFVSRYIDQAHIEIVDTDDNVADTLHVSDLPNVCDQYGLDVKGYDLFDAVPYQIPEMITKLQARLKMLSGIEVTTWGSSITSIRWESESVSTPVSIRLSDFGTSLCNLLFYSNSVAPKCLITFILDDKLSEVEPYALSPIFGERIFGAGANIPGVCFDLRGVMSECLLKKLYATLANNVTAQSCCSMLELKSAIVDSDERKNRLLPELPLPF